MLHDQDDLSDPAVMAYVVADLHQELSGRYRHVDEQLLVESIEDAVLHLLARPELFDASRGVPRSFYLKLWVRSYLDKKLRKEKRHRQHEKAAGVSEKIFEKIVSEVGSGRGIYLGRDRSEQEEEEREEEVERERKNLDAIVARLNPCDQVRVQLLRVGASREEWVGQLEIEDMPLKEQQGKVNAEKDRLMKKLKRRAQKMPGGGVRFRVGARVRATCFDASGERESWLTHLRKPYIQQVDGSREGKHFSVSYSLFLVCC